MSVIVEDNRTSNTLICKGAVEEIMRLSTQVEIKGEVLDVQPEQTPTAGSLVGHLNAQGFRVDRGGLQRSCPATTTSRTTRVKDESDLTLLGFMAFLDPPKETATEALKRLHALNVDVKILTGDNEIITTYICKEVGHAGGQDPARLSDRDDERGGTGRSRQRDQRLCQACAGPQGAHHHALQSKGHVVGFMGDGINDAPALKAADVGISVDSAVDIAKESSDIILLENSLLVLEQGVLEGRRVFGNIIKYIKMAASSNFGNMFSVVGASVFLPFLPMLPIQVLTNNLLYDFSQTTIPTDEVDADWLTKPRKWAIGEIQRFILFIGPISSIFDYLTFFIMLYVFNAWNNPALFHTGWFVESLFTQTLIIHVIRTEQDPVHPEPGQLAADRHLADHRGGGRLADGFAPGRHARVCPAAAALLAAAGDHAGVLRGPDPVGEDLVLPEVWRINTMKGVTSHMEHNVMLIEQKKTNRPGGAR